ncbi:hypothetical protein DICPUDRAFT_153569 [Dictyostelium purpureum]|uniref:WD40 repeat-containing protein n=1 Tax=Dictyostelium purpureum TaxID=5786 RepID=F0ZP78_DICPU|nr:uncharacterized protein DICPUDRAFT_153569 [Dictyostelium purpureum]EGC34256.1 hypothetical protein DICPUDRAFT_153569 [Dictyostelium purpureum]|eukprot:XP_003289225.1 hypothetical protein DICPUDRAFT_153569 [Dictyostelium purpureum]
MSNGATSLLSGSSGNIMTSPIMNNGSSANLSTSQSISSPIPSLSSIPLPSFGKSSDILVPVVLWCGSPTHWITSIIITPDKKTIITGSQSGHLSISSISLDQGKENQFTPKILAIGHENPITCLALGEFERKEVVISAATDGSMAVWSITDGLCLLSTVSHFLSFSPTQMTILPNRKQVAVCGKGSNSIFIVDIHSLRIVSTITDHMDWVTSLFSCTMQQDNTSMLLSGSLDGIIRFWLLRAGDQDMPLQVIDSRSSIPNYTLDDAPLSIKFSPNGKSLLVVSKNNWSIFTTQNSRLLYSIRCPCTTLEEKLSGLPTSGGWFGGAFVDNTMVLVWNKEGRGFLYKVDQSDLKSFSLGDPLPIEGSSPINSTLLSSSLSKSYGSLSSSQSFLNKTTDTINNSNIITPDYSAINFTYQAPGIQTPQLLLTFSSNDSNKTLSPTSNGLNGTTAAATSNTTRNNYNESLQKIGAATCFGNIFIVGDPNGHIKIWVIPVNSEQLLNPQPGKRMPLREPNLQGSISDGWKSVENKTKMRSKVTASLVLDDSMILIRGYEDGSISTSKLPSDLFPKIYPASHNSKVNYLMSSPPSNQKRLLFSASNDCTIKVWDLSTFKLLHTFSHHTGPVYSIFSLPHSRRNTFISISEDKTIGMYSMEDLSCKHMFGVHSSSISKVYWKNEQGYLMVETIDGSVSIWEIGSGELEGVVYGQNAKDILDNSELLSNNWKQQESKIHLSGLHYPNKSLVYTHKNDPPIQTLFLNIKAISNEITVLSEQRNKDSLNPNGSSGVNGSLTKDLNQLVSIFSYLIPWNMDRNLDPLFSKDFQLRAPLPDFSFGLLGHGGNMSLLTPMVSSSAGKVQCSETLTAQTTLAAISLGRSILRVGGMENIIVQLTNFYCATLPESLQGYVYPDFSYLAQYCQDVNDDVMVSARSIFRTSIEKMPSSAFKNIVNSYCDVLNADCLGPLERARAIIVLAIITSNRTNTDFNTAFSAKIGSELQRMIYKGSGNLTIIAVELLGKGFQLWKDSIKDLPGLLKCLFALTMQADPLASTAKNTLLLIGSADPKTFIQVIGDEISNESTNTTCKVHGIVLIGSLIKKDPDCVLPFLPRAIDSIIKSLDPHALVLREACIRQTTAVLHLMVNKYPMVSFHHDTQRLVLGTLDGLVVIYDLKTATRWHRFESFKSLITAVTFNENGKMLACYSSKENEIKIWQANTNFFGFNSQFSCIRTVSTIPSEKSNGFSPPPQPQPKTLPVPQQPLNQSSTRPIIPKIENVKLVWQSQNTLVLTKDDTNTLTLNIPSH